MQFTFTAVKRDDCGHSLRVPVVLLINRDCEMSGVTARLTKGSVVWEFTACCLVNMYRRLTGGVVPSSGRRCRKHY